MKPGLGSVHGQYLRVKSKLEPFYSAKLPRPAVASWTADPKV